MAVRFFSPTPVKGPQFELTGQQAHHAVNVMRLKRHDQIRLFDSTGREFLASVISATKKSLMLSIEREEERTPDPGPEVTIAVSFPKGDRQKFMIEKLVELGAANLIPLTTARSVAVVKENVVIRIEKQIIEACKQCGRNRLMKVKPALSVSGLIAMRTDSTKLNQTTVDCETDSLFLLADPDCGVSLASIREKFPAGFRVVVAIGPEGGFDPAEILELLDGGFEPFQIGNSILRIETAAIAATTLLRDRS